MSMSEQSVIAWDLETVPDLKAVARMLDMEGEEDEKVRAALGSGFPKHPLHKIVCIGGLVASRQPEGWQVDALGAPHIGERPEAELIRAFVDKIGQLRPQLVTFNGNASLRVTPTTDREAVKRAIEGAQLGERTAIGEAIFVSLDALKQVPASDGTEVPARIVLMTDGTTTDGRTNDSAVAAAKAANVPVSTIAFGTDAGTITIPQEPLPIPVPVDKEALTSIASDTGGKFYAATSETQLKQVYDNIGSSVGFVTEQHEISTWFIAGALLFMLITGGLSLIWFQRLP